MSIHHSTKKKAELKGIQLEDAPDNSNFRFRAFWPERSLELWGDNATVLTDAMIECRTASLEYGLRFEQDLTDGSVEIQFGIKTQRTIGKVEHIEDLASTIPDVLEDLTSDEADQIEEADATAQEEETERGGSVVPDTYKRRYAEAGHPSTCGDWLSDVLNPLVTNNQGKLDADAMAEVARLNGVSTDKLNRTTAGWQGRFRMTARNLLVKVVAKNGFLSVPASEDGDTVKAPAEWVAANQPKTKEPGDKTAARKAKGA